MTALKKICPRAHFEKCRSDQASLDYCNKSDTRVEGPLSFGEKPMHRNSKADWDQIWEAAKRGDVDAIPAEIRIKNYRTIRQIQRDYMVM